jgi:hypothetical protein
MLPPIPPIERRLGGSPEECVEVIADLINDHRMSDPNGCPAVDIHCTYDGSLEDLGKVAELLASQFTREHPQWLLRVDRDSSSLPLIYIQVAFSSPA